MGDNLISFNVPNMITVGIMALLTGAIVALGMKGYQKYQGQ